MKTFITPLGFLIYALGIFLMLYFDNLLVQILGICMQLFILIIGTISKKVNN